MLDTITRRAKPTAASQAANTIVIIGITKEIIECMLMAEVVIRINRDSIIPSRHRRVDIMWDRNISVPRREKKNAIIKLMVVGVIW